MAHENSDFPPPEELAKRVVELVGGHERFTALVDAEYAEIFHAWNQDVEGIGRILRAHLYLERFLTRHLAHANPKLGDMVKAKLHFSHKVAILNPADDYLATIIPGIRKINTIRNRLAHQLGVTVSTDDVAVFLACSSFAAMRVEGAKPGIPSADPMDIFEEFAKYAASVLNSGIGKLSAAMAQAIDDFRFKRLLTSKP